MRGAQKLGNGLKKIPLNPWPKSITYGQQSLVKIRDSFVRVHRYGAPGPGAARHNPDIAGDGRVTFVLVHGIGLSSQYLAPLADELTAYGEVMVLDLPGFGDLPRPQETLTIPAFAATVHGAMELYGVKDPILVGHSMGAQIVTELMARYGYRRAALIGPPVNQHERSLPLVAWRYLQSAIFEKPNLALVALRSYARTFTSWVFETMPALMTYRIEDRLTDICADSHVAILHGEHDYLAPSNWVEELAQACPHSDIRVIRGAAHSTVYNDDSDVAQALEWLMTGDE